MSDITPGSVTRSIGRWSGTAIIVALIFAGIVIGGWQAGWWFSNQNVNRQAHQTQNGYSNQTTLHQQVTANIATVTSLTTQIDGAATAQQAADLKAQRAAVASTACEDAAQVSSADPLPAQQQQWANTNCANGSISPTSPLYQAGTP